MEIKDVRVKVFSEGKNEKVKGVAAINFDDLFVVHDIRIIEGDNGLFISFPSRKNNKTGVHQDIAHPLNTKFRDICQSAVLKSYAEAIS